MFLAAPPALRRRRAHTVSAAAAPEHDNLYISGPHLTMGNSLSNSEREALTSAAATVTMATSADPQATALRGGLASVLKSSPSHTHAGAGAAVGARGEKFQCRW